MAKVEKRWDWETEKDTVTDYEEVGEVEWSEESYAFNLTRVYKQISTGALFYATDAGCSCPYPFEDTEDTDLTPITRMQDWYDHVTEETVLVDPDEEHQYPYPTPTGAIDQANYLGRQINALLREDSGTGRTWTYESTTLY